MEHAHCSNCGAPRDDPAGSCPQCGAHPTDPGVGAVETEPGPASDVVAEGGGPTPPPSGPDPNVGRQLGGGKYSIVESIGAGGMGRVYFAVQKPLDAGVCVKTLHPQFIVERDFAARFFREAKAASTLNHPNIVRVYDFGQEDDGTLYIVMEMIQGRSLSRVLKRLKTFPQDRAVKILTQVCEALEAAHRSGIIHRDLKPGNLMLVDLPGNPDFVKVLDFGSASMRDVHAEDEQITRQGSIIGTPSYMAPEYLRGDGYDHRLDLYAAGTILYQMLTGSPPFAGRVQASIFARQVFEPPEPPSRRNPDVDIHPRLEEEILRCLEKEPARRHPNALELKRALLEALQAPWEGGPAASVAPAGTPRGSLADRIADLRAILPSQVMAEITATRQEQEGELREAFVVRAEPDEALPLDVRERSRIVHAAVAIASDHGAFLDRARDLPIVILVGLDAARDDDRDRALRIGLELAEVRDQRTRTPALRIGVAQGKVSATGRLGDEGFQYRTIGEWSQGLRALVEVAGPGQVLVGEELAKLSAQKFRLAPIEPREGEPESGLYQVLAPQSPEDVTSATFRVVTPFVGREEELRVLTEAVADERPGTVLLLTGEPGIGKSRLLQELGERLADRGILWHAVRAAASPWEARHPLLELGLPSWGEAMLGDLDEPSRRALSSLRRSGGAEPARERDGQRIRDEAVGAVVAALKLIAQKRRLVVAIDDLQAADGRMLALAQRLVLEAGEVGVSLVLAYRSDFRPLFLLPKTKRLVELEPLSHDVSARLVRAMLGDGTSEPEVVAAVTGRAAGNPLILEQRLMTLRATGKLVRSGDGVWSVTADAARTVETEDLRSLVRTRLDAVTAPAQALLGAAAVLGEEFSLDLLVRVAGGGRADLEVGLQELRRRGLVVEQDGRLRFPQPVIRDVVLDRLDPTIVRAVHARAAQEIQREGVAAGEAQAEVLGRHLARSGDPLGALHYFRLAAGRLRRAYELERAAVLYEEARALVAGLHDGPSRRSFCELSAELGETLLQSGELARAESILRDGYELARRIDLRPAILRLLRLHGRVLAVSGETARALRELEGALKVAEAENERLLVGELACDLAELATGAGDAAAASSRLLRGLDLVQGERASEALPVLCRLLSGLGRSQLELGNLDRSIAFFGQALTIAEQIDDRSLASGLLGNIGGAYARRGEVQNAHAFTERGLALAEEIGDRLAVARQAYNLATIVLLDQRVDDARTLYGRAYEAARRIGWREGMAMSSAALERIAGAARARK